MSIMVDTFGSSSYSNDVLIKAISEVFDLRPAAIIEKLSLRKPIYRQLASYGHMGREDLNVSWEKTDMTDKLKEKVLLLSSK